MLVTLFFTYDISIKTWAESGLLQREIQFYKELKNYGVDVQFLTYGDSSDRSWDIELEGIKLIPVYEYLPRPKLKILRFLISFFIPFIFYKELCKSDLFKTNQIWGGWVAVISKWIFRKPLLVRCGFELYKNALNYNYSFIRLKFIHLISWLTYHQGDHILLSSSEISQFVSNKFEINTTFITVIPNWIDTVKFYSYTDKRKFDRILFVGRLSKEKNLSLLFEAIKNTSIGLDVVGSGNLLAQLTNEAQKEGFDVQFLGRLPNDQLPDLYNKYLIYVICSHFEGNPKSLLEAMSCGCAVIGTNVPGIRDVICHEVNGLLVDEVAGSLQNAIFRIHDDPKLGNVLGQKARQQIIQQNSFKVSIISELRLYQKLCSVDLNFY